MLHKMLNKLLTIHFRNQTDRRSLNRLEQDVWYKIHTANTDTTLPWQEKLLLAFGMPRFQLASLAIAMILGLSLSLTIPPGKFTNADQLVPDMSIFTIHAPYLATNLIEQSE